MFFYKLFIENEQTMEILENNYFLFHSFFKIRTKASKFKGHKLLLINEPNEFMLNVCKITCSSGLKSLIDHSRRKISYTISFI